MERCANLATLEIDLWVTIFEHVDNILARMLCGSPCKVWVQVFLLVDLVQSSEKIYVCCIGFLAGEWRVLKFKEMSFALFLACRTLFLDSRTFFNQQPFCTWISWSTELPPFWK